MAVPGVARMSLPLPKPATGARWCIVDDVVSVMDYCACAVIAAGRKIWIVADEAAYASGAELMVLALALRAGSRQNGMPCRLAAGNGGSDRGLVERLPGRRQAVRSAVLGQAAHSAWQFLGDCGELGWPQGVARRRLRKAGCAGPEPGASSQAAIVADAQSRHAKLAALSGRGVLPAWLRTGISCVDPFVSLVAAFVSALLTRRFSDPDSSPYLLDLPNARCCIRARRRGSGGIALLVGVGGAAAARRRRLARPAAACVAGGGAGGGLPFLTIAAWRAVALRRHLAAALGLTARSHCRQA